jgi:hypothetical protein
MAHTFLLHDAPRQYDRQITIHRELGNNRYNRYPVGRVDAPVKI